MENIISLNDFCGGSLLEKANTALKVVLENMQDPNTPMEEIKRAEHQADIFPEREP